MFGLGSKMNSFFLRIGADSFSEILKIVRILKSELKQTKTNIKCLCER